MDKLRSDPDVTESAVQFPREGAKKQQGAMPAPWKNYALSIPVAFIGMFWAVNAPAQTRSATVERPWRRTLALNERQEAKLRDSDARRDTAADANALFLSSPTSRLERLPQVHLPPYHPMGGDLPPSPALAAATQTVRANASNDGQAWVRDYQPRMAPNQPERWWSPPEDTADPQQLQSPWWDTEIRRPHSATTEPLRLDIAALTAGALQYSSFVRVVSMSPSIQQSELVTQTAAFDWQTFLETTYNDVHDPVGSLLVTGTDADRYTKQDWSLKGGIRRKNALGGEVEAFQRVGCQEDNSRFLNPNPQRATRLELQYTQPLLKGAGRAYNQSLIVLAQVQLDKSSDALADELEAHLVKVTQAFWELYRTRAVFLQRRKLLASAKRILVNLEGRREVDAVERQVFRARTAVANRESEMLRAETQIRDWQSQLRLLVNVPELVYAGQRPMSCLEKEAKLPVTATDTLSAHHAA